MDADDLNLTVEGRALLKNGTGRAVRLSRGLSYAEEADAMSAELGRKVSPSTLHRWESGSRVPRAEAAAAYARVVRALIRGPSDV